MTLCPHLRLIACGVVLALLGAPSTARAAGDCRFKPAPPVTLQNMGPCEFDPATLSFKGEPAEQARCLLTPVQKVGRLGPPLAALPAVFAERLGRPTALPARDVLRTWLAVRGHEQLLGAPESAVSRAGDNDPASRSASYLVIHDTSTPNYGHRPWPKNIDEDKNVNNLARYVCANDIERAHVFINRKGDVLLSHDFEVPWRATKFEMATNFGTALKGLFLHVELVQPRRRDPKFGRGNDFLAPVPGFAPAQYEALALVYVTASVRAGRWLIPAFHAVLDEGIRNKHDDPQNFELDAFARALEGVLAALKAASEQEAAN